MLQLKDDIIPFLQLVQLIGSLKMKNYCWPSIGQDRLPSRGQSSGQMNRSCSKTSHHTFASRIRKKTSQIEVKLTVWTMSGKPNGQYGT